MTAGAFPRVHRPCAECPWRQDTDSGQFPACRYDALRETSAAPELGTPMFACHKSPEGGERACAGWLAVEGHRHPAVRLAVYGDRLDPAALAPRDGWPALWDGYDDMAEAMGVDDDIEPEDEDDEPRMTAAEANLARIYSRLAALDAR